MPETRSRPKSGNRKRKETSREENDMGESLVRERNSGSQVKLRDRSKKRNQDKLSRRRQHNNNIKRRHDSWSSGEEYDLPNDNVTKGAKTSYRTSNSKTKSSGSAGPRPKSKDRQSISQSDRLQAKSQRAEPKSGRSQSRSNKGKERAGRTRERSVSKRRDTGRRKHTGKRESRSRDIHTSTNNSAASVQSKKDKPPEQEGFWDRVFSLLTFRKVLATQSDESINYASMERKKAAKREKLEVSESWDATKLGRKRDRPQRSRKASVSPNKHRTSYSRGRKRAPRSNSSTPPIRTGKERIRCTNEEEVKNKRHSPKKKVLDKSRNDLNDMAEYLSTLLEHELNIEQPNLFFMRSSQDSEVEVDKNQSRNQRTSKVRFAHRSSKDNESILKDVLAIAISEAREDEKWALLGRLKGVHIKETHPLRASRNNQDKQPTQPPCTDYNEQKIRDLECCVQELRSLIEGSAQTSKHREATDSTENDGSMARREVLDVKLPSMEIIPQSDHSGGFETVQEDPTLSENHGYYDYFDEDRCLYNYDDLADTYARKEELEGGQKVRFGDVNAIGSQTSIRSTLRGLPLAVEDSPFKITKSTSDGILYVEKEWRQRQFLDPVVNLLTLAINSQNKPKDTSKWRRLKKRFTRMFRPSAKPRAPDTVEIMQRYAEANHALEKLKPYI